MPEFANSSTSEDLPEVNVALVLQRTQSEALVRTLGRKRGERFLREWMRLLATEDAASTILPFRPPTDRPAQLKSRRQAVAWLRQVLPTLIASLPCE